MADLLILVFYGKGHWALQWWAASTGPARGHEALMKAVTDSPQQPAAGRFIALAVFILLMG